VLLFWPLIDGLLARVGWTQRAKPMAR